MDSRATLSALGDAREYPAMTDLSLKMMLVNVRQSSQDSDLHCSIEGVLEGAELCTGH